MERYIDLHTHSLMSDGSMTPAEVVREAKRAGLAAIALSDHDSVSGVKEAMAEGERIGVEVVPAIEFSVQSATETHILAYYLDIDNPVLLEELANARKMRDRRNAETARKLQALGWAPAYDLDLMTDDMIVSLRNKFGMQQGRFDCNL